jgi:predicted aminopeptidase
MRALWALAPLFLSGCYLLKQAEGQIHLLLNLRDVGEMLADPAVPDATKERLRLVGEIREFGERRMGLRPSRNYTVYYDTKGKPITYVVSACRKDRFEPYTWWFPIVGTVPYKGFFRRSDALQEAQALADEGYDVQVGTAAAYSTLGYFPDPVLSTMLDDPDEQLAALILHELTHGTLYVAGGTDFNEGLASFVGWQGALEFARETRGIASEAYERTVRAFAREERRDAEAKALVARLQELYRSQLPPGRKIELRDQVAGRRVNNAEILMQRRYGRYDEFRAAFERSGADWRRFFETIREERAARSGE